MGMTVSESSSDPASAKIFNLLLIADPNYARGRLSKPFYFIYFNKLL